MIQTLQLRHSPTLESSANAWFFPGDSVAHWLEELARCGLAAMDTRLFLVPRSMEDQTVAGLLVVPTRADAVLQAPSGFACRLIAGRLFVPVDAVLQPPVTDAEVRSLCVLPVYFLHPIFGLSGFEEESSLRVSDLVQPPEEQPANWNFARSGIVGLPALSSVVLLQPPSIEDVFGGAPDEIGSEPPDDLPPAPDEPREDPISKTGRNLGRLFLKGLSGAMRHIPHIGWRRTWVNDLEDWANKRLHGLTDQLEKLRNKELNRLLHLLETDPEAGLRHAIPMNNFGHRGVAPPGGRLGSHSLDFNPGRLGGRPADFWNVSPNVQEILRRRYREMADREMQLGRHRRAAYIYAELLGDLVSAANALKQGRLFREAALLYEEYLKNPIEAARCLAEGGLLAEAIERYEKLERWLDVADLQERAGNVAAAEKAFRRVVEDRVNRGDILGAAKLVEERLHQTDEALQMLLDAWPSSSQAGTCLGTAIRMLARLGRHETTLEQLKRLRREPVPKPMVLPLLSALDGTAREYPHDEVRHRATDFSRLLIAAELNRPGPPGDDVAAALDYLVRLAPHDRLLSRDTNRYLTDRRAAELRARRVTPPPVPANRPVMVRRLELPRQIQWVELRSEWNYFFALGVTARHLTLVRGLWEGEYQSLSWDCSASAVRSGFVFEPTAEQGRAVALARASGEPLQMKRFPAADLFFSRETLAGTPSWLPTEGFPFAIGDDSVWSVHVAASRAVLSCHGKVLGQLQRTIDITEDLLNNAQRSENTRLSLAALKTGVAVALGNRLVITRGELGMARVELPGQVVRLVPTFSNTRPGVAVTMESGAVMYWAGAESCIELDRDMPSPMAAFVPGGPLVVISNHHAALFEVDSRGVQSVTRMDLTGQRPVGVCAAANPGEFAVLGEGGELKIYRR